MSNNSLIQMTKSSLYSALVLVFLSLFGCATVGSIVPVEKRVALSEARTIQDTFKADGWRVDYSYIIREGTMSITCRPSVRFKVEAFDVRILFIDVQGTVLEQKLVYSSGQRNTEKSFDLPSGTVGISFTYSSQPYRGHA